MGLFNKDSIDRKDLEKVLKAQEVKMRALQWEKEKQLTNEYENKLRELRDENNKRIEQIYDEHNAKLKVTQYRKIEQIKELMEDKEKTIKKLEKENIELLKRTRRYKEAYELYRDNRNRIIDIAREMGLISDKVTMTAARINSFFSQISDLAEANMRTGLALDPKIEALMFVDETTHEETHLRLIETKVEEA